MNYIIKWVGLLSISALIGCTNGVRKLDLVNKQFRATYNVDSTRGIDSTQLNNLLNSTAMYDFGDDGKGTSYIQQGMVVREKKFTWRVVNDSLYIDQTAYNIQPQGRRFVLRSDSVKIILSLQK